MDIIFSNKDTKIQNFKALPPEMKAKQYALF